MPSARPDARARAAARATLWRSALWSGVGAAVLGATIAVLVVAIVWLPASGGSGSAGSTLRAGALTFLAGLHAGITVDGVHAAFVPLGLTLLVGLLAWRSGAALAEAADEARERDPGRLVGLLVLQAGGFAATCAVLASLSTLGTSSVDPAGAAVAGFVLCGMAGGAAVVRGTALRDDLVDRTPEWIRRSARAAAAAVTVYLVSGALLVAASLVVHHDRVSRLSSELGGGWSGVPVLLLGLLAAPNAVVAGTAYLSGAGFAVGSGTTVAMTGSTHGLVPAFPLLGALPDGAAGLPVWLLALVTPVVAAGAVATVGRPAARAALRWREAGAALVIVALVAAVAAWLAGGAMGPGSLDTVGASPWLFPLFVVAGLGVATAIVLGAFLAVDGVRDEEDESDGGLRGVLAAVRDAVAPSDADLELDEPDELDPRDRGRDRAGRDAGRDGQRAG